MNSDTRDVGGQRIGTSAGQEAGADVTRIGRFFLVVIGINRYQHWPELKTAVKGAQDLRDLLCRDYGFELAKELYEFGATRKAIVGALAWLVDHVGPEDSVLIYFAGHGHINRRTQTGAWIPVDGEVDEAGADHAVAAGWIDNSFVRDHLKACRARHILLVSDSCFAGDFLRGHRDAPPFIDENHIRLCFKTQSRSALTAGGLHPVQDGGLPGHSVFTGFLLNELRTNDRPWILPSELYPRIRKGVGNNSDQVPQFGRLHDTGGHPDGEFVLFRRGFGTLEAAIAENERQLQEEIRLASARQESRERQAAELAARRQVLAEKERQLEELRRQNAATRDPALQAGGLDEILALLEEIERQEEEVRRREAELEAARRAEEERIAREKVERLAFERRRFGENVAKYEKVLASRHATDALKAQAWMVLCRSHDVVPSSSVPGRLEWTDDGVREAGVARPAAVPVGCVFVNSLGMQFVPVATSLDGKQKVLFSIWETRVQDYAEYARETAGVDGSWKVPVHGGVKVTPDPKCPVVNVSWEDAKGFCRWLTKRDRAKGLIPANAEYRLPTDAEWSWAVGIGEAEENAGGGRSPKEKDAKIRAGTHPYAYPWGKDWPPKKGAGNYADERAKKAGVSIFGAIHGYDDGYATTSPVGSFAANPNGLFDLGGNVWEWVEEVCDGKSGSRALRGGSWRSYDSSGLLSSYRYNDGAGSRDVLIGFRVVLVGVLAC